MLNTCHEIVGISWVCWSSIDSIISYHKLGGLNNINVLLFYSIMDDYSDKTLTKLKSRCEHSAFFYTGYG